MKILIKLFLTYTAISMTSALVYFFLDIVLLHNPLTDLFVILWLGPLIIGACFALPYGIYELWRMK